MSYGTTADSKWYSFPDPNYAEYLIDMSIDGDGPFLTDHGPATPKEDQAIRRHGRRDMYRNLLMIDTVDYLNNLGTEEINE